jgi:pimeloyl-ACP methyl ester carboxylesterase
MKSTTLIFLHYFGGSKESWNWTIADLVDDFNCVALNLPGFGGLPFLDKPSLAGMAEYVTEQIQALNTGPCILIGHSMGGKIAVQVAIQNAENDLISQLILVAPSPPSIEKMPEDQRELVRGDQGNLQAIKSVNDAIVKSLSKAQNELAVKTQMEIEVAARKWWVDEGTMESVATESKNLEIPITLIVSKTDPAITYDMTTSETIPNLPKHAKLIVTTDIGHLIPLEDPAWLAETIKGVI